MLDKKIDFVALFSVEHANPNGDPLNGNRPREDYDGFGEISDVCLKRKLRNRLQDMGENLFVQMAERADDGYACLSDRAAKELKSAGKDKEAYAKTACEKWIDVRSFGQVFAFKAGNVSVGVRGPVSIHPAFSIAPVDISTLQITKSVNSEPGKDGGRSSDTMGTKHRVDYGLYMTKGSINCQLAEKTGFSAADAEKIYEALCTLFDNDASAARPEGSLVVERVYWWEHDNKSGQYSPAKVHGSVRVKVKDGIVAPKNIDDYDITVDALDGLTPVIFNGRA